MFTSQVISLAEQYLSKPVETYITMKYVRVRTWFDIFVRERMENRPFNSFLQLLI